MSLRKKLTDRLFTQRRKRQQPWDGELLDEDISTPYDMSHVRHIDIDLRSSTGFTGLPSRWRTLLKVSGITPDDVQMNSAEVLAVLNFHTAGPPKMPTTETLNTQIESVVQIVNSDPGKYLTPGERLGRGATGKVFSCVDKRNGKACAVKMSSLDEVEVDDLKQEIAMHALSRHPNVVKYQEAFLFENHIWIVMELMEGGNLTDLISVKLRWPEDHIAFCMGEVLKGLSYLHSNFRLHRDIKSDNLLWDGEGRIKLADFGFAANLTDERNNRNSVVGTPFWMAPEIIKGEHYTNKVDVWSTGITAYEIATGAPPFMQELPLRALYLIAVSPSPTLEDYAECSKNFRSFVRCAVIFKPKQRASVDQLLMHPFMRKPSSHRAFAKFAKRRKKEIQDLAPPRHSVDSIE